MYTLKTGFVFGNAARLWFIFVLAGLFAWASPYLFEEDNEPIRVILVGAFGVLAGLILKYFTKGLQIDISGKRVREYISYFGIKFGDWSPMPHFSKVVHTSKNVTLWNTPNGISPTFKTGITLHTIGLFGTGSNPEYIIQSESEELTKREAKRISELLNVTLEHF